MEGEDPIHAGEIEKAGGRAVGADDGELARLAQAFQAGFAEACEI